MTTDYVLVSGVKYPLKSAGVLERCPPIYLYTPEIAHQKVEWKPTIQFQHRVEYKGEKDRKHPMLSSAGPSLAVTVHVQGKDYKLDGIVRYAVHEESYGGGKGTVSFQKEEFYVGESVRLSFRCDGLVVPTEVSVDGEDE